MTNTIMVSREYKGVTYKNNKWYLENFPYSNVAQLITFAGNNTKYAVNFTDDDFIPLMELKNTPYDEIEYKDILRNVTDEQLNTEYFRRFADLLQGCSSKRLIAELKNRGFNTNLM